MNIPKSFELFGQTITVEFVDDLVEEHEAYGLAVLKKNTIQLQASNTGVKRPDTQIEQTFLHELTHYIYSAMGETKLHDNEKHIELFSQLLHQALTTQKY